MFESKAPENPYPESEYIETIRPRPIILYLGGSIGVLVCLGVVFELFIFLSDPIGFFESLDWTASIVFLVQGGLVFLTYRWFTICGKIKDGQIILRGWFKTLRVNVDEFYKIDKVYYEAYSETLGSHQKWSYVVYGKDHQYLGGVPGAMQFCKNWDGFMQQLNQNARSQT